MNENAGRARELRDLILVARRELAMRMRGTAFRVSTILLLAGTVAAIAIPLDVTTVTAAGRAATVQLVEQGKVTAAVAAGGEIIWKASPDSTLQPLLTAVVQQAIITQRAASMGLPSDATARLLAPVQITNTHLHSASQRTARMITAEAGMILLYLAITVYGSYVLTRVVEEKSSRVAEVLLSRVPPSSLLGGKIAGIGLTGSPSSRS